MRVLMTIFLSTIVLSVSGQDLKSDSILFQENLNNFINREFFTLTADVVLSRVESRYGTNLNSLGKCLVIFRRADLGKEEKASMTVRIQEIAKHFFDQGTPIYLSIGGGQRIEWTANQNKNSYKGNLTFVSLGNYCVVEKGESDFETAFNKKTLELIGIERVEECRQPLTKCICPCVVPCNL
jgi:hypothetical protein